MIFTETALPGVYIIDLDPHQDERGFFARTFCQREFDAHGLTPVAAQSNLSFNHRQGTLRGLHFQYPPAGETKFVRCSRGAILDVIVDLRPESPAYRQWDAVELTADNRRMLYMPEGIAHGYLTLADGTEAYYHASAAWTPHAESGIRWNDPAVGIEWPFEPVVISDKDRAWPLLAV